MSENRPSASPTLASIPPNGTHQNTTVLKKPRPIDAPASPRATGDSCRRPGGEVAIGSGWGCSTITPPAVELCWGPGGRDPRCAAVSRSGGTDSAADRGLSRREPGRATATPTRPANGGDPASNPQQHSCELGTRGLGVAPTPPGSPGCT